MAYTTKHTGKDGVTTVTSSDAPPPAAPAPSDVASAAPVGTTNEIPAAPAAPAEAPAPGATAAHTAAGPTGPAVTPTPEAAPGAAPGTSHTAPTGGVKTGFSKVTSTLGGVMLRKDPNISKWATAGAWVAVPLALDSARLAVLGRTNSETGEKERPWGRIIIEGGAAAAALYGAAKHGGTVLHGR